MGRSSSVVPAGDGILVWFNSVTDQPDHAVRAARCALEMVRVTDPIAASHPGWPRFRIGLNTGPAVVGNVGAAGRRSRPGRSRRAWRWPDRCEAAWPVQGIFEP